MKLQKDTQEVLDQLESIADWFSHLPEDSTDINGLIHARTQISTRLVTLYTHALELSTDMARSKAEYKRFKAVRTYKHQQSMSVDKSKHLADSESHDRNLDMELKTNLYYGLNNLLESFQAMNDAIAQRIAYLRVELSKIER